MIWRILRAALLPLVVCFLVPALILRGPGAADAPEETPAPLAFVVRLRGLVLGGLGLALLVQTVRMFEGA